MEIGTLTTTNPSTSPNINFLSPSQFSSFSTQTSNLHNQSQQDHVVQFSTEIVDHSHSSPTDNPNIICRSYSSGIDRCLQESRGMPKGRGYCGWNH
ncbi:hypothetical protein AQUCO_01800019v1 [Aquilegia coerulea]|uniref:Uncharacterized protein n=1 Tax=Aquilegia coerulea TaxID=218851 RepID=A0A2G5DJJ7_AQUCA|nr:hypothetical protein AQUCO_01800019v1 [Aquilegia coerulea]